jgi:hypothetical protein
LSCKRTAYSKKLQAAGYKLQDSSFYLVAFGLSLVA